MKFMNAQFFNNEIGQKIVILFIKFEGSFVFIDVKWNENE